MAVHVTHAEPISPPIETIKLTGIHETREIVVRPCYSSPDLNLRTIICSHFGARNVTEIKWATTLDNLEAFGEALVRLAREGKAAL